MPNNRSKQNSQHDHNKFTQRLEVVKCKMNRTRSPKNHICSMKDKEITRRKVVQEKSCLGEEPMSTRVGKKTSRGFVLIKRVINEEKNKFNKNVKITKIIGWKAQSHMA